MNKILKRPEIGLAGASVVWVSFQALHQSRHDREPAVLQDAFSGLFRPLYCQLDRESRKYCYASSICSCEEQWTTLTPASDTPTASWFRKALAATGLASLPIPRRIQPGDPLFNDASLRRGLRKRQRDEQMLRSLQKEAVEARNSRDPERIKQSMTKISEIAFGKGVTPQMREDFLIRYGCTGWTQEVLETLVEIAGGRGFVEIGAGHGQWARAISEFYREIRQPQRDHAIKPFEFVLAYDDMSELPLSTKIYHSRTQAAHDYFYSKVNKCENVDTLFRQWSCRGRVLLLVYPPPGNMALDTIKSYVEMGPENDMVVLVGEGRGGANANDDLFTYLEKGDWIVLDVLPVLPSPGGKGYEKLYVLHRIKSKVSRSWQDIVSFAWLCFGE